MSCGCCADEMIVGGLDTVDQVMTVQYAFWSRHEHDDEPAASVDKHAEARPVEDWERELLDAGTDEGDDE